MLSSMQVAGLNLIHTDNPGKRNAALKCSHADLPHQAGSPQALLHPGFQMSFDGQRILQHRNLEILWIETWQQRLHRIPVPSLQYIDQEAQSCRSISTPGGTHKVLFTPFSEVETKIPEKPLTKVLGHTNILATYLDISVP